MAEGGLRLPPHNLEAEKSVLGAMLQSDKGAADALGQLKSSDFYAQKHRDIFRAMQEISMEGTPIDAIIVLERMKRMGYDPDAETKYIGDILLSVPSVANLPHYMSIIQDKATLRRLIDAAHSMEKDALDDADEVNAIVARANDAVYNIAVREDRDSLKHVHQALVTGFRQIGVALSSKTGIMGRTTGIGMLDRQLSGLQGSQLIVLAGRPGMGKTSLGLDIVRHIAINEKAPCAVFSLEMSAAQLATRLMCSVAMVDMQSVRNKGPESNEALELLIPAMEKLNKSPLYIDDSSGITVPELLAKARKLKIDTGGLGLVMVDYLQLMTGTGRSENRQLEVSEMTRQLKVAARELDTPILLLSQLSRASERRGSDKTPMLSDLRESGSIEQDADVVLFIHRDSYYDETATSSESKIIVAKQRMGPTGNVYVKWVGSQTRFTETDQHRAE